MKGDLTMARVFKTEHEARVARPVEPDITEIHGIKVTTIDPCLERNCEGNYEWFYVVDTWSSSFWCSEDGEVLDEFREDDYDDDNAPCDTYGPWACNSNCPNFWQCHA